MLAQEISQLDDRNKFQQPIFCLIHNLEIDHVCLENSCAQQRKIGCIQCMNQYHHNHQIMTYELFIKMMSDKIQQNQSIDKQTWNDIITMFDLNYQQIKCLSQLSEQFQEQYKTLQTSIHLMLTQQTYNVSWLWSQINKIKTEKLNISDNELNLEFQSLKQTVQYIKKNNNIATETNQLNQSLSLYFQKVNQELQLSSNVVNQQQGKIEGILEYEQVSKMKKQAQQQKNMKEIENQFHRIKGKAKKRDIINFITLDSDQLEIKYQKDIKDKKGEHFYVGFTLELKNLDSISIQDINHRFIEYIINYIKIEAPKVHEEKDSQRKKLDYNGKKRKYCRFHPILELDLNEYYIQIANFPDLNKDTQITQ